MKKIAVITRNEQHCGIYGYTASALELLTQSTQFTYELHPCDLEFGQPHEVYIRWLESIEADAFLYNFCPVTMPWLFDEVLQAVKRPHFVISGHDVIWASNNFSIPIWDRKIPCHIYNVDPSWQGWFGVMDYGRLCLSPRQISQNDIHYHTPNYSVLPRPVIEYPELQYSTPGDIIKIVTFGISSPWKNYDKLVQKICDDFPSQPVHLTIRATQGRWVQQGKAHDNQPGNDLALQAKLQAKSNVTVEIVHDWLPTSKDIAVWLNGFDLIFFYYEPNWNRFAVSSSLDHALAAKKPIAINDSKMFSHVRHVPEIYIEHNTLPEIINRGIQPLQKIYAENTKEKFINAIETPIRNYYES